ncbi:MAG: hypothetical protein HY023_07260 [Chloroflexi bacterium]|nr:hypothetical protein [Chloroflexota bacterium]
MRAGWGPLVGLLSLALVGCGLVPPSLPTPPPVAATIRARTPVPTFTPAPPTETFAPSATPQAAAISTADPAHPPAGELLFEYTFDSAGNWGVGEDEASRIAAAGGVLNITLKRADWTTWTFAGRKAGGFYAEVSADVATCGQDDSYGLLFRVVDANNFYLFGLGCDARYRVRHRQDGEWNALVDWTPTPAIRAGGGARNLLAVRALGDEFKFFVNGEYLGSASDSSFAEGTFGLFAQAGLDAGLSVDFDNLRVRSAMP